MIRNAETVFLGLLAAFLVGFCALGLFYYAYPVDLLRFPLLAAGFTLVVTLVQMVSLGRRTSVAGGQARLPERRGGLIKAGWLLSVLPLVFLCGFPAALALYLFGCLKSAGESWGLSLVLAASSLLLSYGLFIQMIGIPLPLLPLWWPS